MPKPPGPKGMLDAKARAELRESAARRLPFDEERIVKRVLSDSAAARVQGIARIKELKNDYLKLRLLNALAVDVDASVRSAALREREKLGLD